MELDQTPALVVIDLQRGLASRPGVAEVIERAGELARAFRTAGLPVALVNVTGGAPGRTEFPRRELPSDGGFADLVEELDAQPSDLLITKQTWGAFTNTALDEELRKRNVTQIVLTGVATSIGVESTARAAYELGYHVVPVTDAMTDMSPESHDYAIGTVFPRLGQRATTQEVLEAISKRG